ADSPAPRVTPVVTTALAWLMPFRVDRLKSPTPIASLLTPMLVPNWSVQNGLDGGISLEVVKLSVKGKVGVSLVRGPAEPLLGGGSGGGSRMVLARKKNLETWEGDSSTVTGTCAVLFARFGSN